jgi:hypothetical protein
MKWKGRFPSPRVEDYSNFPVIDLTPPTMLSQPIIWNPEEQSYEQTYQSVEPPIPELPKSEMTRDAFVRLLSNIRPDWSQLKK